jgi:hypothetical protein
MENSPFGFLFGNTSTTTAAAAYAEEPPPPPPAEIDPFKIPMKIVGRIMDNCYTAMGQNICRQETDLRALAYNCPISRIKECRAQASPMKNLGASERGTDLEARLVARSGSFPILILGNLSDRGDEYVKIDSGKSAMDQEVMGNDTLQQQHAEDAREPIQEFY